jgi:hypothetical protein
MLGPCKPKNRAVCGGLRFAGAILERRLLYRNAKTALMCPEIHDKFINCLFGMAKVLKWVT